MAYDANSDEHWTVWASTIRRDVIQRYFERFRNPPRAASDAFFAELARRGGITPEELDKLWKVETIPGARAKAFAEAAKLFAKEFESAPVGTDSPPWIPQRDRESWSHGTAHWLIGPDGVRYPTDAAQVEIRHVSAGMEITFRDGAGGVWSYRGDTYPGESRDWHR